MLFLPGIFGQNISSDVLTDPTTLTDSLLTHGFLFNDSSNLTKDNKTGTIFTNSGAIFSSTIKKRGLGAVKVNLPSTFIQFPITITNYEQISIEFWVYVESYDDFNYPNDFYLSFMPSATATPTPGFFEVRASYADMFIPSSRSTSTTFRQIRYTYPTKIPLQTWTHLVFSMYRSSGTIGSPYSFNYAFYNGVLLTSGGQLMSNPSLPVSLANVSQSPLLLRSLSYASVIIDSLGVYITVSGANYPYTSTFNPETNSRMLTGT